MRATIDAVRSELRALPLQDNDVHGRARPRAKVKKKAIRKRLDEIMGRLDAIEARLSSLELARGRR